MEGAEPARHGDERAHGPGEHQQEGVGHPEPLDLREGAGELRTHGGRVDALQGPQDGGRHQPVQHPDQDRIQQEQPAVAHVEAGDHAVVGAPDPAPDAAPEALAVAKPPAKVHEPARSERGEDEEPPEVALVGEAREQVLRQEGPEPVPQEPEDEQGDGQEGQSVPHAVRHDRAQGLVEGDEPLPFAVAAGMLDRIRMLDRIPAADDLAHAGEDVVRERADIDGVPGRDAGRGGVQRQQLHPPAERAEPEGRRAQRHGQDDIPPAAFAERHAEILPVHSPEGKVQEQGRDRDPEPVLEDILHFLVHCSHKVNGKSPNNV